MTYFTGNVKYETQGLLSPRKDTETVKRLSALEFLRFVAVLHYIANEKFDIEFRDGESWVAHWGKNLKHWGYTQPNFLFLLSGFVLAYNYAPTLQEDSRFGYNVFHFLLKRLCWLFPTLFVACFLPVWNDPTAYLSTERKYLKFMVNIGALSAFWPPSFRTYKLNTASWAASVALVNYVITMPLFLKPIHRVVSRESRIWLLVFLWPWTWFMGFVVEKFDIVTYDGTTHWDWRNPIFYMPSFLMGMVAGSIFVERPEGGTLDPRQLFFEHFGGTGLFVLNMVVMSLCDHNPMLRWHQVGSLSLLQIGMIYSFALGKDKIFGLVFMQWPFRFLGGFAFVMFATHHAVYLFAQQIETAPIKTAFFTTFIVVVVLTRVLVEIPYARWALAKCEKMFGSGGE